MKNEDTISHILVTGIASLGNKGQLAMLLSLMEGLRKKSPGRQFTVISYDAQKDAQRIVNDNVRIIPHGFYNRYIPHPWSMIVLFTGVLRCLIHVIFWKLFKWTRFPHYLKAYHECDLVVDISGDSITDDYGFQVTLLALFNLYLGVLFNKPTCVCAQTLGLYRKLLGLTKRVARFVFKRVSLITLRDEESYSYLQSIGVTGNTEYTADLAFNLEPIERDNAQEILKDENIQLDPELPIVAIAPSSVIAVYASAKWGSSLKERRDTYLQCMADVSTAILKQQVQILFIPHVVLGTPDDLSIIEAIIKKMKFTKNVHRITEELGPRELKGIIRLCDAMVGSRMHSTVASAGANVPTIAIAYSKKYYGVVGTIIGDENVCDVRYLAPDEMTDKIISGVSEILATSKNMQIKKVTETRLENVHKASQRNIDLLEELLTR